LALSMPMTGNAAPGDYCLGEWTTDAQTYCKNVMNYVQAVAIDRKLNRHKDALLHEVPEAMKAYGIPANLATNYIHFVYQHDPEDVEPSYMASVLFGGCINNFESISPNQNSN